MDKQLPFVSIILPIYNEEIYLRQCLYALLEVDYPRDKYEIITVDNGSTDNSLAIAMELADNALVLSDCNVGAVRNYGVENSKGEIIVFLDSDCLVSTGWLKYGVECLLANPMGVFGGYLFLRPNPNWIEKYWLLENPKEIHFQGELLGSCIFILKNHFWSVGGFNENITSGEDTDLSLRIKSKGYSVFFDRRLGVVHLGNPTSIRAFINRQIWHSENYIVQFRKSYLDKTFWLVFSFLLNFLGIIAFWGNVRSYSLFFMCTFFIFPLILSCKRLQRVNFKIKSLKELGCIYILDFFYLVGRSIGLIKSAITAFNYKI
jgi:glycosyltransferase involved in cell wall biosynthesis